MNPVLLKSFLNAGRCILYRLEDGLIRGAKNNNLGCRKNPIFQRKKHALVIYNITQCAMLPNREGFSPQKSPHLRHKNRHTFATIIETYIIEAYEYKPTNDLASLKRDARPYAKQDRGDNTEPVRE